MMKRDVFPRVATKVVDIDPFRTQMVDVDDTAGDMDRLSAKDDHHPLSENFEGKVSRADMVRNLEDPNR